MAEPSVAADDIHVMQEGHNVIIDTNGEKQSCIKLVKGGKVKVGKSYVSVESLFGERYGTLFEVSSSGVLEKRNRVCETAGEDWEGVLEIDKDNSQLLDAGVANQGLTTADIDRLKAEGKSGDEIVAALTAGSATFQNKTQYSQEKYKRKKAKKYNLHVTAVRPVARSLADFYFNKVPVKTGWLRPDSLAILLTQANIGAATRVLVVDGTGGLVAGAVMERMGGTGTLVNGYVGDKRISTETVSMFNFPQSVRKQLIPASIASLRAYLPGTSEGGESATAGATANGTHPSEEGPPATAAPVAPEATQCATAATETAFTSPDGVQAMDVCTPASDAAAEHPSKKQKVEAASGSNEVVAGGRESKGDAQKADKAAGSSGGATPASAGTGNEPKEQTPEEAERQARYALEREEKEATLKAVCLSGFQSCIVSAPQADPGAVLEAVFPLLAPSACFSVFFHALHPLAECMNALVKSKRALGMQLQESWFRQYQVLPGRTHPTMATSGTGGYILSGTKVLLS